MAQVIVDKNGTEYICSTESYQDLKDFKQCIENLLESNAVKLPKSSIKKLIGRDLSYYNEPVKLEED